MFWTMIEVINFIRIAVVLRTDNMNRIINSSCLIICRFTVENYFLKNFSYRHVKILFTFIFESLMFSSSMFGSNKHNNKVWLWVITVYASVFGIDLSSKT